MAHYETLRSRIRKARRECDMERELNIVRLFLDAVRQASVTGMADERGLIPVDATEAYREAVRLGVADSYPMFIGGGDHDI